MRQVILTFALTSILVGCSAKQDGVGGQAPVSLAGDLGKADQYFRILYGVPKSEKRLAEFDFALPSHASLIRVSRSFVVRDYASDSLKAQVLYPESGREAIWVRYTLRNPWTQEQIVAALQAYGSGWKVVQETAGTPGVFSTAVVPTGVTLAGLYSTATLIATGAMAQKKTLRSVGYKSPNEKLNLALVGCGGRGTGAAVNALSTKGPTKLWAMADVFPQRLEGSRKSLEQQFPKQVEAAPERCFIGLDAFKKAIDSLDKGDVVLLATPPAFRPIHRCSLCPARSNSPERNPAE